MKPITYSFDSMSLKCIYNETTYLSVSNDLYRLYEYVFLDEVKVHRAPHNEQLLSKKMFVGDKSCHQRTVWSDTSNVEFFRNQVFTIAACPL